MKTITDIIIIVTVFIVHLTIAFINLRMLCLWYNEAEDTDLDGFSSDYIETVIIFSFSFLFAEIIFFFRILIYYHFKNKRLNKTKSNNRIKPMLDKLKEEGFIDYDKTI